MGHLRNSDAKVEQIEQILVFTSLIMNFPRSDPSIRKNMLKSQAFLMRAESNQSTPCTLEKSKFRNAKVLSQNILELSQSANAKAVLLNRRKR